MRTPWMEQWESWKQSIPFLKKEAEEQELIVYEQEEVTQEIIGLVKDMKVVNRQFETELDQDMIEANIWRLKYLEARYSRAIKRAKKLEINRFRVSLPDRGEVN